MSWGGLLAYTALPSFDAATGWLGNPWIFHRNAAAVLGQGACDRLDGINQTGNGVRWSLFSGKYERLPGEYRQENMRNLR
ncbi:hypothetical protein NDU88_003081 [Pleurodeles waltl]|uniref:Uncharacterized protein n=1 Tax=Pleurodeles waltl TaxID=8319 RepID=A0AAV7W517_PLEWA|nr:hypothetical protein NDU88_003081 [Pleurodeles waltl]